MTAGLYSHFDELYNGKAMPTANEHQGQHYMQKKLELCLENFALIQDVFVSFLDKSASDSP